IGDLILQSRNREILIGTVHSRTDWTQARVQDVLKRLWNHGPKALEFFEALDRHPRYRHSAAAFDGAIDIAARLRDYKRVWNLIRRMRSRKLKPSPKTFSIVIERYASAGRADKAVNVFLTMHRHGCPQDLSSFNAMLDVLCKSKRAEKAHKLFTILRGRFRADAITYNIIAYGFCLKKQTSRAVEVMKEMVERGLIPTLTTYNILLKGYFGAGQIKQGLEFFSQLKKRNVEMDAVSFTTVVHGLGVAGEIEKARKVFREMSEAGVLPTVASYNAMIQILCKKDSVENAMKVFDEMQQKGTKPNATTYNLVIRGLCHVGKFDMAIEYMDRMKENGCCTPTFQTFNIIIRYYCDEGEIEKAMAVFKKMTCETCLANQDTYNVLISSMFARRKSEDLQVAGELLIEMVGRGFLPRRFTVNRVLNGLLVTGNQTFARQVLRVLTANGLLPRKFKL
ncbi:hypothetical protein M569_07334, partial [Genlisea aurea]